VYKKDRCLQCATLHGHEDETRFAESIAAPPGSWQLSVDTRRNRISQARMARKKDWRSEQKACWIIQYNNNAIVVVAEYNSIAATSATSGISGDSALFIALQPEHVPRAFRSRALTFSSELRSEPPQTSPLPVNLSQATPLSSLHPYHPINTANMLKKYAAQPPRCH
jgi:hypothetical protein